METCSQLAVTDDKRIQISVASIPARLAITQTMICDFTENPCLGAKVILGDSLDAFQSAELKKAWWTPRVMDSSGLSASKSIRMWICCNLRCILMPDHWSVVYYQFFEVGQRVFWANYVRAAMKSRLFSTQIGNLDAMGDPSGKATRKGQSTWTVYFKNGSKVEMPAGGFDRDSINQAGTRTNDLYIDEWTKIESTGSTGIDDQLAGRATRECFNKNHPFWCNKVYFLATAEDTMHPSYDRYLSFKQEVDRGNPDYVITQRSYKDYSNLKYDATRTFKEVFVEHRMLKDMRKSHSISGFMQEALGLWSKNGKGWYTQDVIDRAYENGANRGTLPIVGPHQDWARADVGRMGMVRYFMGVDPARSETAKAADGAMVVLRAEPAVENPTAVITDWKLDFVWAFKVRRADAPQWAAITHRKNQAFNFDLIEMDSQGGGQWIQPELARPRQNIRGEVVEVQPIASIEEEVSVPLNSRFILSFFRIQDRRIQKAWGHMRLSHPSNLVDTAHVEFLTAFGAGIIGLPPKLGKRDMSQQWSEERVHANQMLDLMAAQLTRISVRTDNSGKNYFNSYMAREFGVKGKKDFAYAGMYAFTAFFCWLKSFENEWWAVKSKDRAQMASGRQSMTNGRSQNLAAMTNPGIGVIRAGRRGDLNPYA